jgi:hypothetical protein
MLIRSLIGAGVIAGAALIVRQPATDFRDRCNAPIPDGTMG